MCVLKVGELTYVQVAQPDRFTGVPPIGYKGWVKRRLPDGWEVVLDRPFKHEDTHTIPETCLEVVLPKSQWPTGEKRPLWVTAGLKLRKEEEDKRRSPSGGQQGSGSLYARGPRTSSPPRPGRASGSSDGRAGVSSGGYGVVDPHSMQLHDDKSWPPLGQSHKDSCYPAARKNVIAGQTSQDPWQQQQQQSQQQQQHPYQQHHQQQQQHQPQRQSHHDEQPPRQHPRQDSQHQVRALSQGLTPQPPQHSPGQRILGSRSRSTGASGPHRKQAPEARAPEPPPALEQPLALHPPPARVCSDIEFSKYIIAFYFPGYEEPCDKLCKAAFLGNFYQANVAVGPASDYEYGRREATFWNAEAAFQALKFWRLKENFQQCITGEQAFKEKCKFQGSEDWSYAGWKTNWAAMMQVLRKKFAPGTELAHYLGLTHYSFLLEHNSAFNRDRFWSDNGDGSGFNWLGMQLMLVREELRGETGPYTRFLRGQGIDLHTGKGTEQAHEWRKAVQKARDALAERLHQNFY